MWKKSDRNEMNLQTTLSRSNFTSIVKMYLGYYSINPWAIPHLTISLDNQTNKCIACDVHND